MTNTAMTNIEVFQETMSVINTNPRLAAATLSAINNTVVYEENTRSHKTPHFTSDIRFEENLTLIAAHKSARTKKTAVLNFANPVEPGGGVLRGANAQEEYLCRASNLYPCLVSEQAKPFYESHGRLLAKRDHPVFFSSDRIVYSKNVTVVRKDNGYSPDSTDSQVKQDYTDDWYTIDVITCAAPYIPNEQIAVDKGHLKDVIKKRIKNICEVAIENDIQSLILGAFGCGAFHNPPSLVAGAFSDVFLEQRYMHAFEEVIFAVKRTGFFCRNIEAFEVAFSTFPPTGDYVFSTERNKQRFF